MTDTWNQESDPGSMDWNSVPASDHRDDLQTAWEDWDNRATDQTYRLSNISRYTDRSDAEESEIETSPKPRLRKLAATFKRNLRHPFARLRKLPASDNIDDGSNNQYTDDWAWENTEELEAKQALAQPNGPLDWACEGEGEIAAQRALEELDKPAAKPLDFTDPLSHDGQDFLLRFLANPRHIAIHPERKHKLTMFMLRLCQEAYFEHVKMHAPWELTVLQISSSDAIEFQYWLDIIVSLRSEGKIPKAPVIKGENPGYYDGVNMLRHTAEHRLLDYDSKLIEYLVWHLRKLDDEPRRNQLASALEQVYRDECAVAAAREAHTNAFVEDLEIEQQGTTSPVSTRQYQQPPVSNQQYQEPPTTPSTDSTICLGLSSTTLVGSSSDNSIHTVADDLPSVTTALEPPTYLPAIETPPTITTHSHFLKAVQTILEPCLFNQLRRSNPKYLASNKYITPSQIELNKYCFLYERDILQFGDADRKRVSDYLYGARQLRNASAHHLSSESPKCLHDKSQKQDSTPRFFQDALSLADLASDSEAAREIRLVAWVAAANLGKAALKIKGVEAGRTREEWQALYDEAQQWNRRVSEKNWWLRGRLEDSKRRFWGELYNMQHWIGVRKTCGGGKNRRHAR
ncbi:MAG: hypothetical protein Q9226_005488 [Calogaya cf. arnoldii]